MATRQELLTIRDATYRPPPEQCCWDCRHSVAAWEIHCRVVEPEAAAEVLHVHPAGRCDLWEAREDDHAD